MVLHSAENATKDKTHFCAHTVDGRNPAPVDMVNIPLFVGFYTSQVVQDFVHQQYGDFLWPEVSMPFFKVQKVIKNSTQNKPSKD